MECECEHFTPAAPLFSMKRTPIAQGEVNCVLLHEDKLDLGIYENDRLPGVNHHFDEAAWGSNGRVPRRGPWTHPCFSAVILPLLKVLPYVLFPMSSALPIVSLHKRVHGMPQELKQGSAVSHSCPKSPHQMTAATSELKKLT